MICDRRGKLIIIGRKNKSQLWDYGNPIWSISLGESPDAQLAAWGKAIAERERLEAEKRRKWENGELEL